MALFTDFAPALTFATERAVPSTGDGVVLPARSSNGWPLGAGAILAPRGRTMKFIERWLH